MTKTSPLLRMVRMVQFIKTKNHSKVKVNKQSIFHFISMLYPDNEYSCQMFDRDKRRIKEELGIALEYNSREGYYINSLDQLNQLETSLDYYELFSVLNHTNALPSMFLLSERQPKGVHLI